MKYAALAFLLLGVWLLHRAGLSATRSRDFVGVIFYGLFGIGACVAGSALFLTAIFLAI